MPESKLSELQKKEFVTKRAVKYKKDPKHPVSHPVGTVLTFPHLSDEEIKMLVKTKVLEPAKK
jgi:hypothetical protein